MPTSYRGAETPTLTISTNTGVFRINARATRIMKLKKGATVSFYQDQKYPGDWYMKTGEEDGFVMRENVPQAKDKVHKVFTFGHKELARTILDSINMKGTIQIPLSGPDTDGRWTLETKKASASISNQPKRKAAAL
ncbi:hypothetical protein [Larkinella ripae]